MLAAQWQMGGAWNTARRTYKLAHRMLKPDFGLEQHYGPIAALFATLFENVAIELEDALCILV